MRNRNSGEGFLALIMGLSFTWIICGLLLGIGWIINVVHIVSHLSGPLGTEMVVRLVGVPVFPLGGIMGLFVW